MSDIDVRILTFTPKYDAHPNGNTILGNFSVRLIGGAYIDGLLRFADGECTAFRPRHQLKNGQVAAVSFNLELRERIAAVALEARAKALGAVAPASKSAATKSTVSPDTVEKSDRAIAAEIGVSDTTVLRARRNSTASRKAVADAATSAPAEPVKHGRPGPIALPQKPPRGFVAFRIPGDQRGDAR